MPIETVGLEIQDLKSRIIKLDTQNGMMRKELMQCLNDYKMWQTAHGSDYPVRRMEELRAKLEEIEKV